MNTRKEFIRRTMAFAATGALLGCEPATAKAADAKVATQMKTFKTKGTCSQAIKYAVKDGVLIACEIVGGCPGNARGIVKLVLGRKATEVIALLKGIPCRNGTSCPDQLARALELEISAGRGAP